MIRKRLLHIVTVFFRFYLPMRPPILTFVCRYQGLYLVNTAKKTVIFNQNSEQCCPGKVVVK